jgi:hypothetical protein
MTITQSILALVGSKTTDTSEIRGYEAETSPPFMQSRVPSASYGLRTHAYWPRVVPPRASGEIGRHCYAYERTQSNLG